jgi:hypothetical protein
VSGNFEALDFDNHNGSGDFFRPWCDRIPTDLLRRLVIYRTPSHGWRACYRLPPELPITFDTESLAQLPLQRNQEIDCDTVIERLGCRLIYVPGGDPAAHPSGKPYEYVRGHLCDVQTLSPDEHASLLHAARSFDAYVPPPKPRHDKVLNGEGRSFAVGGWTPGDDFNQRAAWEDILEPHGWTWCRTQGEVELWARPGKACRDGHSATTDYHEGLFYVFSSNCDPFEAGTGYSKFAAYTLLNHDGDYSAAAQALREQGYGRTVLTPQQQQRLEELFVK